MDNPEVITIIKKYEEQITILESQLNDTKEHLKKYTAPSNMKKYYENHKEEIKQRVNEYKEKTNYNANLTIEKKKKYARQAYLNKKEKLKILEENDN
jgi:hypothetical protein